MPVFLKQGRAVLYVHVPKTGGTAIEAFFKKNGFRADFLDTGGRDSLNRYRRCAPQHMSANQIMAILRPDTFDYVFMTVREPLSRVVSEYKMHQATKAQMPPLSDWLHRMLNSYVVDSYIAENHLRPQVEFVLPNCDVFRLEDGFGAAFVERIEDRLGFKLEDRQVEYVNVDNEPEINAEDIARIAARVRRFYIRDYITFGY